MEHPLNARKLLGYIGGPELHDAVVVRVDDCGEDVRVVLETENGEKLVVSFSGVKSTSFFSAEGMTLYGLAEAKGGAGLRRFIFVNWDEEDSANLEVMATGYSKERT